MGRSTDVAAAYDAVAITPSDSTVFRVTRAIYVGVSGNIAVRMASGATVTYTAVPIGVFPVQVDKVLNTNTTATTMIAMY